jgi:hypothetical protein
MNDNRKAEAHLEGIEVQMKEALPSSENDTKKLEEILQRVDRRLEEILQEAGQMKGTLPSRKISNPLYSYKDIFRSGSLESNCCSSLLRCLFTLIAITSSVLMLIGPIGSIIKYSDINPMLKDAQKQTGIILEHVKEAPILQVQFVNPGTPCPVRFQKEVLYEWEGSRHACVCGTRSYDGVCSSGDLASGCTEYPSIPPQRVYI